MRRLEHRVAGEWRCECFIGPDDWSVGFLADGRYIDIYRPDGGDDDSGRWSFDEQTGIISIELECVTVMHVFEEADEEEVGEVGGWLYIAESSRHIPLDRNLIIAHHAHTRYGLVR